MVASPVVLTDVKLVLNSVNLELWITKFTLGMTQVELDTTAMGTNGWTSSVGGLKSYSITPEFLQDYSASAIDATIFPVFGTTVAWTASPTSGSVSATNPLYSGNVLISGYTALDGNVGDISKTSATWKGTGAITRATS